MSGPSSATRVSADQNHLAWDPAIDAVISQFLDFAVWPFGRNVYVSEIYRLLDRIPGVDFVTKIDNKEIITAHDVGDRSIKQDGELVAIRLNPDELVKYSKEKSEIVFNLTVGKEP